MSNTALSREFHRQFATKLALRLVAERIGIAAASVDGYPCGLPLFSLVPEEGMAQAEEILRVAA